MKFVLYTNSASEHQLPLAREIVAHIGATNFLYVYTGTSEQKFQKTSVSEPWLKREDDLTDEERTAWLEEADMMLVGGIRPIALMERRVAKGLTTCYMSERWFKPMEGWRGVYLPGRVRLWHLGYRRMAKRFARLFNSPAYRFLPIGVWSANDMRLIEKKFNGTHSDYLPWGDFVAPGSRREGVPTHSPLRVLFVGRFLALKHIDSIIRAVKALPAEKYSLTLVGEGPEEARLKKLAAGAPNIEFRPPVAMAEVRAVMRAHDVLVLASNACEGWGCVVNEAMEEGLRVLGTNEAGASATLLPPENRFACGDWRKLRDLLSAEIKFVSIGEWTAEGAAIRLLRGRWVKDCAKR